MESFISAVAPNIFECCAGATRKHLGYIWNYKKNIANLEAEVEKLDKERVDKNHSVTVAEKDAQRIKHRVKSWQDEADKTSGEAAQIVNYCKEKGQNKCLMGLCPNLISRYQLSKRACKKEAEIVGAIGESREIKKVSDRAIAGLGKEIALSTEGVFTFKSRESVLENIMKTLQDETKNVIGVYGFGGMGKTTLVKQVAKRADEDKMFEEIVYAPVTEAVELKKVQEKIASTLDLKLKDSTEAETASLIYGRLKGKKVLVILDDLWEELDLKDVGIPSGAEHMSCKILLTSRNSQVLSSMGTKTDFPLTALEEEEAWRLFEEKTIHVIKDPALFSIGKEVAKRCVGLPVLIVTTAASLSKRPTASAWNDTLRQLKKMDNKQVHEYVNSAIKSISYNHLGEKHKKLFLLCAIVGSNVYIEHLLQYSWGLDMFVGEVATMGEARDRLDAWILDLKDFCLLLDSDSQRDRNSIKMHDVVRGVAISIAEKDFNMLSVEGSGAELNLGHRDGVLKRCTRIVLRGCPNLSCLLQLLECPSLELFILSRQYEYGQSSFSIPSTFFEKTSNLKVLDMSQFYVSTLPSSLSFLKNLQTFRVDYCYSLKDISIVGELKKLQTLSLGRSSIEELPSAIGKLVELRLLDLSKCSQLRIIPAGLIAGLSRLEELKMRSFNRWDVEDRFNPSGRANVSLLEMNHLSKLTSLEIQVSNAKLLSKDLSFEKWEKYEIIAGDMWNSWDFRDWLDELEITRKVCLQLSTTSINHLQHVVEKLFKRTECLCLGELNGVKNVTPELDVDGFPYMKHLRIDRDYEIQYIVNVEYIQHKASFPALESLHLSRLQELQKICNGRLMGESFYHLKVVKVKNCNRLESLFSFSMAIGLRCLQEIHVSECSLLEEIVAEKNREDDDINSSDGICEKIEFEQLRKLSLKRLPKLNNFFAGKMVSIQKKRRKSLTTNADCEEIVSEEGEFKSSMPLFRKVLFPKLEELEFSEISNLTQIWSHELSEMPCCNLTRLTVEKCDNLKYLLTPSISRALVGLRDLIVRSCVKMKSIVAKEEGETKMETICFPHLSYLCLESLPNLITFYPGSVKDREPNESLGIVMQPLFNEKVSFPKMEKLELSGISNSTEIWNHQVPDITTMTVQKCNNLEYILTPSMTTGLVRLQQLTVRSCARMKHVVAKMKSNVAKEEEETKIGPICFPHLSNLCLESLPNLTTFYLGSVEERDLNESLDIAIQPLFNEKVKLPILKTLKIRNLDGIKIIWPHMSRRTQSSKMDPPKVLGFRTLQQVKVYGCRSLEYVIPAYMVEGLNKLEELSIRDCGGETIIGDDKDAEFPTFTFPKLVKFNLDGLSKLKCFYPREHTTQWPALAELAVSGCDEIQPSILPLFSIEKVAFPSSTSFKNLLEMEIKSCVGLKYLFTPSIAMNLEKVQKLAISKCSMMKAIVSNEEGEASNTIIFPQLVRLWLEDLPNLARFYSSVEEMDSNEKLDYDAQPLFRQKIQFPRLLELIISRLDSINSIWQNVTVCECKSLKRVFSVSGARSLHELEHLSIRGCEVLETIIGDENDMERPEEVVKATEQVATTFTFPKLARLDLEELPKMKFFYPREHTTEWPVLEKLEMSDCGKMTAFDLITIPQKQGDNQFQKVISKLKSISITSQDMIKLVRLYDGHIPQHLFGSLETLTITDFHGEATTFPWKFLSIIHNQLQMFGVCNCSFEEIFPFEGEVIDHANSDVLLPQLRELVLNRLPELKYICEKDQYIHVLDKLVRLWVTECPLVTNLVPPSVSFKSLKYLIIKNCGGLISLMHPSTATSLEHLEILSISGCERIEEIIREVKDGDQESSSFGHEIIFNNLWSLELVNLPRLINFSSSRSYSFNFPVLDEVSVQECPNMKTFCGGITTTPELTSVYLNESQSEKRWEGELNTTIEQIYAERSATNQEEVANIVDKGKGKEVDVSKQVMEDFEKSQETPRSSNPSCSNYAARGQTLAASLAPCQHVGASSSQLSPQISNPLHEVSPLAIEREVQALTAPTISSHNQIEEKVQSHDKPTGVLLEPKKEGLICNNGATSGEFVNPGKDMELCCNATEPIKGSEIGVEVTGDGKDVDIGDKAIKPMKLAATCGKVEEQAIAVSQASRDVGDSSYNSQQKELDVSKLTSVNLNKSQSGERWEGELNTTIEHIHAEREAKGLAMTIPSTSSNNQFEENSAEGVSEARMEGQTRENATNQEWVANIVDKGKGKEVEVSKEITEHFEKPQEAPCSSDPSCSNYAAYLAPSQHVGATSSQLSPQISNPLHEVSPAFEGEVQTVAASTISPNNQIEEKVQFHDNPRKKGLICKNGELVNEDQVCDNGTDPGKETELCGISKEVTGQGKEVDIGDKAIKSTKLAATCGKVEEQAIAVSQASRDVGASSSNSQQKDIQELPVTKHFKPLLGIEKVADTCEKGNEKEVEVSLHGMEHIDKSKDTSCPSSPTFSNYAAREQSVSASLAPSQRVAASVSQLSPPISNLSDGVRGSSLVTQVEADTPAATEEFEREVGSSSDASNSQRKDFQESHVVRDFTPSLREFLQILQTQPVDNMNVEQVEFMEHAMEWFRPYLQKSRECLDRNQVISKLKLEIAEREMQLQELKEKQKALGDENKATASSIPRFE